MKANFTSTVTRCKRDRFGNFNSDYTACLYALPGLCIQTCSIVHVSWLVQGHRYCSSEPPQEEYGENWKNCTRTHVLFTGNITGRIWRKLGGIVQCEVFILCMEVLIAALNDCRLW